MAKIDFSLKPVDSRGQRAYRKGSKYDPILNAFLEQDDKLVTVEMEKEANYMRTQLNKRIVSRKLDVSVSVVNGIVYLEKV